MRRQEISATRKTALQLRTNSSTRKLLGLGEDCAVLISARVVAIEPHASTAFWDIARRSMVGLTGAQTLKGIFASRNALHRTVKDGNGQGCLNTFFDNKPESLKIGCWTK